METLTSVVVSLANLAYETCKAAEANLPEAENNIGALYRRGEGVPVDLEEAVNWFRRAYNAGNQCHHHHTSK